MSEDFPMLTNLSHQRHITASWWVWRLAVPYGDELRRRVAANGAGNYTSTQVGAICGPEGAAWQKHCDRWSYDMNDLNRMTRIREGLGV
jgi:hypothetical protein